MLILANHEIYNTNYNGNWMNWVNLVSGMEMMNMEKGVDDALTMC